MPEVNLPLPAGARVVREGFNADSAYESAVSRRPDPGFWDYVNTTLTGFNRGVAALAGAPGGLLNLGIGLFGGEPVFGSPVDQVYQGMESVSGVPAGTMTTPTATDPLGRVLSRVGEEIGASAIPALGIVGAGLKRAATPAIGPGGFLDDILRRIGSTPGRAIAGETAAATGAGLGASLAEGMAPGNHTAEMWGQFLGGLAPSVLAYMPANLVRRAAMSALKRVSPSAQRAAANQTVGGQVRQEMQFPGARENMDTAAQVAATIPGFRPTLAERAGTPGLIAAQTRVEREATPDQVLRRIQAEEAISRYGAAQAPEAAVGDERFIVDTASGRVQMAGGDIRAQQADTVLRRTGLADELPFTDRAAVGSDLRAAMLDERRATQARMSTLADQLGLNDLDITVQFAPAREALLAEFRPASVFTDPGAIPGVLQAIQNTENRVVTFADLKALRERVSDDLIDAIGSANPNRALVRNLTMMKERVDDIIADLSLDGDPGLAARYQQFRNTYFSDYVSRFENSTVFSVRRLDTGGVSYQTPDERVATAFFSPGEVTAAREYQRLFGNNPETLAAIEGVALDSLRQAAVRDGVLDPALFNTWMRRHATVLDEFPSIRARVGNIFEANSQLLERNTSLQARQEQLEGSILGRLLRSYDNTARNPEAIVQSAVTDPRVMRQLVWTLGDDEAAMRALRRTIWDQMQNMEPGAVAGFVDRYGESLGQVLTEGHLSAIRTIDQARVMLARTLPPQAGSDVATVKQHLARIIGIPPEQAVTRAWAFQTGRVPASYALTNLAMLVMTRKMGGAVSEAWRTVLYDPEVAFDVARLMRGNASPAAIRRLGARWFALGVTPLEQEESHQSAGAGSMMPPGLPLPLGARVLQ